MNTRLLNTFIRFGFLFISLFALYFSCFFSMTSAFTESLYEWCHSWSFFNQSPFSVLDGQRWMVLCLYSLVQWSLSTTITAAIRGNLGRVLPVLCKTQCFRLSKQLILRNIQCFGGVNTGFSKKCAVFSGGQHSCTNQSAVFSGSRYCLH